MTGTEVALAPQQAGALALAPGQSAWTPDQLEVLKVIGAEKATPAELELFLHVSQRTGLDPFSRQIYLLNYGGESSKATIQTGIDGYRLIARRAADAAGVDIELVPTEWCGPDGVWRDVWLSDQPPAAARITVLRGGRPFPAVALYRELVATKAEVEWVNGKKRYTGRRIPNDRWAKAPASQLEKCAEAAAYRRAFPQDLAGVLVDVEAEHLGNQPTVPGEVVHAPRPLADALEVVASVSSLDELRDAWAHLRPQMGSLSDRAALEKACKTRATELEQEVWPDPPEPAADTERVSKEQLAKLHALIGELERVEGRKLDRDERRGLIAAMAGHPDPDSLQSAKELTKAQASAAIERLTEAVGEVVDAAPDPQDN